MIRRWLDMSFSVYAALMTGALGQICQRRDASRVIFLSVPRPGWPEGKAKFGLCRGTFIISEVMISFDEAIFLLLRIVVVGSARRLWPIYRYGAEALIHDGDTPAAAHAVFDAA